MLALLKLIHSLHFSEVPFVVLLTHPDECCDDLKEDISKIFHRNSLKAMISNINLIFPSLQQDQILPVISYSREVDQELNDSMDILLLYALKAMVDAAQRYLGRCLTYFTLPVVI